MPLQATTVVGARCCAQRGPACSASGGADAALIHILCIAFGTAIKKMRSLQSSGARCVVCNTNARIAPVPENSPLHPFRQRPDQASMAIVRASVKLKVGTSAANGREL